ncbi:MAG: hypothetical protein WCH79_17080 [Planctomycetia bacterium]
MKIYDTISAADAAGIRGISRTWCAKINDEGTLEGVSLHSRAALVRRKSAAKNSQAKVAKQGKKPRPG